MNLGDLEKRCVVTTQDTGNPRLWSRDEWRDYLNEAASEAAIRGRMIDREDIEAPVSVGDTQIDVPACVWSIRRAFLGSNKLLLVDREMLDATEGADWENATGDPIACYEVGGKLRLYPIPITAGTLRMAAFCTPEDEMVEDEDEPEGIPARHHVGLVDWALHLAYSKADADTLNPGAAEKYELKFEQRFGPRPDAKAMRLLRINVRRHVAGAFF